MTETAKVARWAGPAVQIPNLTEPRERRPLPDHQHCVEVRSSTTALIKLREPDLALRNATRLSLRNELGRFDDSRAG